MVDAKDQNDIDQLGSLMALAQSQDQSSRRIVFENMVDLFLTDDGRLSDRERALMTGIIQQLLHEMEMQLRRDLAERLSGLDSAPRELILALANDQIEVAKPVLVESKALRDSDLIEIIRHRSREHQLAVAVRAPLSVDVSQALIDQGEENVVERLLKNPDAALSRRALEYLVAEAQRVGRFQEPVLSRPELPPELAHRLFWYVSAALRTHILEKYTVDATTIDDFVQDSTRAILAAPMAPSADRQAAALVDRLVETEELDERFLVGALRGGKVAAFVAAMARMTRLDALVVRRILHDPNPDGLAVLCKALEVSRAAFTSIFLLSRQGSSRVVKPQVVNQVTAFFDRLTVQRAKTALSYWRADRDYLNATVELARAGTRAS